MHGHGDFMPAERVDPVAGPGILTGHVYQPCPHRRQLDGSLPVQRPAAFLHFFNRGFAARQGAGLAEPVAEILAIIDSNLFHQQSQAAAGMRAGKELYFAGQ